MVFQDYQLFTVVRYNIVLNLEEDPERVRKALAESGILEKIEGLENGIDTSYGRILYYHSRDFSGGETQKIACARAYDRDSPIVILDEPTSGARPRSGNTALRALQRDHRRQNRRLHFTQTCKRQVLRLDRGVCRRQSLSSEERTPSS